MAIAFLMRGKEDRAWLALDRNTRFWLGLLALKFDVGVSSHHSSVEIVQHASDIDGPWRKQGRAVEKAGERRKG
jgi:hypothetical protein